MANTNTSEDAYLIARTSMQLVFGVIERLVENERLNRQDLEYIRSAGQPEAAIGSAADREMLADHINQTLHAIARRIQI